MRHRTRIIASALLLLTACGEDGPRLYIVRGPTATREADDTVRVEGRLWSVVAWPAGHEFCVAATWNEPAPAGGLNMDEICSSDPVPLPATPPDQGEWPFVLVSSRPVAVGAGITIDVTVTSEFFENQDNQVRETVASP